MKDLVVNSLVEYEQAIANQHQLEEEGIDGEWRDHTPSTSTRPTNIMLVDEGRIRIKPNKTYYRAFRMGGANYIHDRNEPFEGFDEWSVSMGGIDPYESIKDFEIEEPLAVNNTITLYEYKPSQLEPSRWMDRGTMPEVFNTGRTITAVIKGDVS